MSEKLYTQKEACETLGVSPAWLYELRKRGILATTKYMGRVGFTREAIEAARGRCRKGGPKPRRVVVVTVIKRSDGWHAEHGDAVEVAPSAKLALGELILKHHEKIGITLASA